MFSRHETRHSESMGRLMHLWRFGHYGAPLLVLPSASGMAHEWQYNGLIEGLRGMIGGGKLKLYCTESNVSESWTDQDSHPSERVQRHMAFERYLIHELVPFIREDCRTPDIRLSVAGASMGAFYAANLTLKHPDIFCYALCMSGKYDSTWLTDGYSDDDVYYNNPAAFVPGLEGEELERVRRAVHLDLVSGQGRFEGSNPKSTRRFAESLREKGIPHRLELWGRDASHEPYWWTQQAIQYLGQRI